MSFDRRFRRRYEDILELERSIRQEAKGFCAVNAKSTANHYDTIEKKTAGWDHYT